jgi:uncharacterized phage-associated protein
VRSRLAVDVREVANLVLEIADSLDLAITNLSLNKIVFFAHAWHLACHDEPLVDSPFEAWQYGPVHPQIHRQLKRFKDRRISIRLTRVNISTGRDVPVAPELTETQREVVRRVTEFYGRYTAAKLVRISHETGAPWDQIWRSAHENSSPGMVIPDEMIREFYSAKLAQRS